MSGVVRDAEWLSMRMMAISSIALSETLSGSSLYAILSMEFCTESWTGLSKTRVCLGMVFPFFYCVYLKYAKI